MKTLDKQAPTSYTILAETGQHVGLTLLAIVLILLKDSRGLSTHVPFQRDRVFLLRGTFIMSNDTCLLTSVLMVARVCSLEWGVLHYIENKSFRELLRVFWDYKTPCNVWHWRQHSQGQSHIYTIKWVIGELDLENTCYISLLQQHILISLHHFILRTSYKSATREKVMDSFWKFSINNLYSLIFCSTTFEDYMYIIWEL